MKSIKTKLVSVITLLIVIVLLVAAFLLIKQKERELNLELFENTNAFAQLTAGDIVEFYNLYLAENSFVYFNREIKTFFAQNPNVDQIEVISYAGDVLYDSVTEETKQYAGESRRVSDNQLLQVQSQAPSIATTDGRVLFLRDNGNGQLVFVNQDDQEMMPLVGNERIRNFTYLIDDAFAVVYHISYDKLDQKILAMRNNILVLAIFAACLAIILTWVMASRIVSPLKLLTRGAREIGDGNFLTRIEVHTNDELSTLADSFNQMASQLDENTKALVDKERLSKELELAAKIQKDILPKEIPKVKGLDISAGLIPAEEIGGDCYDFISLGNGKWIFYLGDVTGHGVPSGIVVSIANAMFFSASDKDDPQDILVAVNRVLKEKTTANMFLTLLLLCWDEKTQTMTYISAGHEPMIHYKAKENEVVLCDHGGIALGMFEDLEPHLQVKQVPLGEGDFLVLYSDGIPEAWRAPKDMYGMERFQLAVASCNNLERSSAIRNAILADVKEFMGGYKQMDDVTVMVVKHPGKERG